MKIKFLIVFHQICITKISKNTLQVQVLQQIKTSAKSTLPVASNKNCYCCGL